MTTSKIASEKGYEQLLQKCREQFHNSYGPQSCYGHRESQLRRESELIKQYIEAIEGIAVPELVLPETKELLFKLCSCIEDTNKATEEAIRVTIDNKKKAKQQ